MTLLELPFTKYFQDRIKQFEEVFQLVYSHSYTNEDPKKIIKLPTDGIKKECLFCGKSHPDVTFRKKSHIIPEALGNKSLLYMNECDNCNESFGHLYDQELINHLTSMRALARKRGRKLSIKYRHGESPSFIEGNIDNVLNITQHEGDDSIRIVNDYKNNSFKIFMKVPPVNHVSIAKCLTRMALMCLPYLEAKNKIHLLDWINRKNSYLPTFYRGFIPGPGLLYTTIAVFHNANNLIGYGEYLVMLMYGNLIYFYHIPNSSFVTPNRILYPPPLYYGLSPMDIPIKEFKCLKDETQKITEEYFEMKYKNIKKM